MHDIYFYEYYMDIYDINTWGPNDLYHLSFKVNPPKPRPKFQSKQPGQTWVPGIKEGPHLLEDILFPIKTMAAAAHSQKNRTSLVGG